MQRSQYLANAQELHRHYYAQFVTSHIKDIVVRIIGGERIRASADPHLNDIPLAEWDAIVLSGKLPTSVTHALAAAGDRLSLGNGVCILKEAAKQIRENT